MIAAIESLAPVLAVIAIGALMRRLGVIDDAGRAGVERLAYYLLFPCLIVLTIAQADFAELPWEWLGAALFLSVVTMGGLCLALRPFLSARMGMSDRAFTSLFQGATRWNTFVALALSGSLFGVDGLALIAVAVVAMVPVLNIMAVAVLARYGGHARPGLPVIAREIARNPFIVSCIVGLLLRVAGIVPSGIIAETLDIFGRAALAVALVAVGLGLDVPALRRPNAVHVVAVGLRLLAMPAIGLCYAAAFGLSGSALGTCLVALAVPTASNAYVLARQMGGDAELMAQIITFQTVAAGATLPLWLMLSGTA